MTFDEGLSRSRDDDEVLFLPAAETAPGCMWNVVAC